MFNEQGYLSNIPFHSQFLRKLFMPLATYLPRTDSEPGECLCICFCPEQSKFTYY